MKETVKRLFLIGLAVTASSSVVMASTCATEQVGNLAVDNGCTLTMGSTTLTFSNFSFSVTLQTSPQSFADNTVSFGSSPTGFTLTDTGDSTWNVTSGQWSFTLGYTVTTSPSTAFTTFAPSEQGTAVTGTGSSSDASTIGSQSQTATNVTPNPALVAFSPQPTTFTVSDVVGENAGAAGTSNMTSVTDSFSTTPVTAPEPVTSALFGSGLVALGLLARRRRAN